MCSSTSSRTAPGIYSGLILVWKATAEHAIYRTRHDGSAGIEILKYIAEKKVFTHKIREEFCTTIIIE